MFDNDGRYDFVIPVEFDVYSGNNSNFELRTPQGSKYSNYRVYVTVGLLDDNKQPLPDSAANDWIIYTNTLIKRDIITPRINSNSSNEQNGD